MSQNTNPVNREGKYSIEPCTDKDGAAIGDMYLRAMWTDPSWPLIWGSKSMEFVASQTALRMPYTLLDDPEYARHQKVVDCTTGQIVGYARWMLPKLDPTDSKGLWPAAIVPRVDLEREQQLEQDRNSADYEYDHAWDIFDEPISESRKRLVEGKRYMFLERVAVHPEHRNRGIATLLVQSGLDVARQARLDVFLHGFKAGLGVYKRAGFKVLDAIIQDDSRIGGNGEYSAYLMEWKAPCDADGSGAGASG